MKIKQPTNKEYMLVKLKWPEFDVRVHNQYSKYKEAYYEYRRLRGIKDE